MEQGIKDVHFVQHSLDNMLMEHAVVIIAQVDINF
jgi:hypothetical protein